VEKERPQTKQKPRKEEPTMQKPEFGVEKVGLEYVNFMRNSFRTWMEGVTLMQNQGERVLEMALRQGQAGYGERSKILQEWVAAYKKAGEQFQGTIEANLAKLEEFLSKKG
jgi:hypothetical protein